MKFLTAFSQAAQRFGNRFSNLQIRVFAGLLYAAHWLVPWAIPSYDSPLLGVFAITLFVLTLGRKRSQPFEPDAQ
ncbi:hypothetical protein [Pseudomonas sp. MYb118]|uniref:hypothetical protein n=1 Tax=Pseudomonas sp. MYb118 TaxID=1848720 RepID=UPI0034CED98A